MSVKRNDGENLPFQQTASPPNLAGDADYVGQSDAVGEGLKLHWTAATSTYTLTETDGTVVTFSPVAGGGHGASAQSPTLFHPSKLALTSANGAGTGPATTFTYDGQGRPTEVRSSDPTLVTQANPAGGDCSTFNAGCRALEFTYTGANLTKVQLKYNDNGTGGAGTPTLVDMVGYTYDGSGRLATATDLRTNLVTTYGYNGGGRINSITPPGQAAWALNYSSSTQNDRSGNPMVDGELTSATRTHNSNFGGGTETSTVAYGVPLSGSGLPDLTAPTAAHWQQVDTPTDATAVFGPETQDTSNYQWGTISYLDVNGRTVNTAHWGGTVDPDTGAAIGADWRVDTTEYDANGKGNVIRTLTGENRARALVQDPTGANGAASTIDSRTLYSADNVDVTDTYGPAHNVTNLAGAQVVARSHSHTDYDTGTEAGHPAGGTEHLGVRQTVEADAGTNWNPADPNPANRPGAPVDGQARATSTDYVVGADPSGWGLRQPLRTTVDPGGLNLVTAYSYGSDGRLNQKTMPATGGSFTADPRTTTTTYYDASSPVTACKNSPAWAGLVCQVGPAGAPGVAGLPGIPTTTTTSYTPISHQVATESESVTDSGGAPHTRVTTTGYDMAERPINSSVVVDGGSPTDPGQQTTTYDPVTGQATQTHLVVGTGGPTIVRAFDDFGRQVSYGDGAGATATTTFDTAGRVSAVTDHSPSATVGSATFSYPVASGDATKPSKVSYSGAVIGGNQTSADVTGAYGPDGELLIQTLPGGAVQVSNNDQVGQDTTLAYSQGGSNLLSYTRRWDSFGRETSLAASNGSGELSNQAFGYDSASRLTSAADTVDPAQTALNGQAAGCQRRSYGFDANSNRTSVTSSSWQSSCPGSGGATVSHAYDSADRLQPSGSDAGMAYDTWGRVTTLPAADASSTGTGAGQTTGNVTSSYWSNDLVKIETQGSRTLSFGLDANYRVAAIGDTATVGATRTNHYSDDGDSASWIDSGNGALSRNVLGLDGNLVATIGETGVVTNQFATPHGDIAATQTAGQPGLAGYAEFDEYGNPRVNNTAGPGGAPSRYGWLGTKRRQSDDLGNITLMGVRLYAPQLGRFLQTDPVPGGSANTYDYVNQNPITGYDLDGRCGFPGNPLKKCGKGHKGFCLAGRSNGGCRGAAGFVGVMGSFGGAILGAIGGLACGAYAVVCGFVIANLFSTWYTNTVLRERRQNGGLAGSRHSSFQRRRHRTKRRR